MCDIKNLSLTLKILYKIYDNFSPHILDRYTTLETLHTALHTLVTTLHTVPHTKQSILKRMSS